MTENIQRIEGYLTTEAPVLPFDHKYPANTYFDILVIDDLTAVPQEEFDVFSRTIVEEFINSGKGISVGPDMENPFNTDHTLRMQILVTPDNLHRLDTLISRLKKIGRSHE